MARVDSKEAQAARQAQGEGDEPLPPSTIAPPLPEPAPPPPPSLDDMPADLQFDRRRIATRRPAIVSTPDYDDIVAKVDGQLVHYRLEGGHKMRRVQLVHEGPVRSSPLLWAERGSCWGAVIVGAERTLATFAISLTEGTPLRRKIRIAGYDETARGFLGDPVMLSGSAGAGPGNYPIHRFAVRRESYIWVLDTHFQDDNIILFTDLTERDGAEFFGGIAGYHTDRGISLVLPTAPLRISRTGIDFAKVSTEVPSGDACAVAHLVNGKWHEHVIVPTGDHLTYLWRSGKTTDQPADGWKSHSISLRLTRPMMALIGNRIVILGRAGAQLRSVSIDVQSDGVKILKPSAGFGHAITGDPTLFRGYAPDGETHLAALVYADVDQILYLWYDYSGDQWSLLPP